MQVWSRGTEEGWVTPAGRRGSLCILYEKQGRRLRSSSPWWTWGNLGGQESVCDRPAQCLLPSGGRLNREVCLCCSEIVPSIRKTSLR